MKCTLTHLVGNKVAPWNKAIIVEGLYSDLACRKTEFSVLRIAFAAENKVVTSCCKLSWCCYCDISCAIVMLDTVVAYRATFL